MSDKATSLKAKIRNYAKINNIAAQVVLQNYMFERFLERLSISNHADKFVVKGGMLIAAIVGLDTRATMDLDTTLNNLPLTEVAIKSTLSEICAIALDDNIFFEIKSIEPIRKDDIYGGYAVRIDSSFDTIITPLTIDISTGDIITPSAVRYEFNGMFDDTVRIELWGYNIETVLAEKAETILSRGVLSTRPRDFYDVYILTTTQEYDTKTFRLAFEATAKHRGSFDKINDIDFIISEMSSSKNLQEAWLKYQKQFSYAKDITYDAIIEAVKRLVY